MTLRPPASVRESTVFASVLADAFGRTAEEHLGRIERLGRECVRVLIDDRCVVGGLVLRFGAWSLDGELWRAAWLSALCVAPHAHGKGLASRALAETSNELRRRGVRVVLVQPAGTSLYARAGFECVGKMPLASLSRSERTHAAEVPRRAFASDVTSIARLRTECARSRPGSFVLADDGVAAARECFVVTAGDGSVVACARLAVSSARTRIVVDGLAALDGAAATPLFDAAFRAVSAAGRIECRITPSDPLLAAAHATQVTFENGPAVYARCLDGSVRLHEVSPTRPLFT